MTSSASRNMKRRVKHHTHRFYAELYPMFDSYSLYIRPDGSLSRYRVTYWSKPKVEAAVKKFRQSPNGGLLLMDYKLFIDTIDTTED